MDSIRITGQLLHRHLRRNSLFLFFFLSIINYPPLSKISLQLVLFDIEVNLALSLGNFYILDELIKERIDFFVIEKELVALDFDDTYEKIQLADPATLAHASIDLNLDLHSHLQIFLYFSLVGAHVAVNPVQLHHSHFLLAVIVWVLVVELF